MSRSKWSPAIASLAVLGLVFCHNIARGEESAYAPSTETNASTVSTPTVVPEKAACSVQQSCNGEMCINRYWVVDVSAVWLAPLQTQHFATCGLATLGVDNQPNSVLEGVQSTTDDDFTISPRIALGIQGDCWGLVMRYWRLQTGDLDSDFAFRSGEGASGTSCFKAETLDLEVTRLLANARTAPCCKSPAACVMPNWNRAAELGFSETGANGFYQSSVLAKNKFSGAGFTLALQGVHPVNCSCFNLFFCLRGSLMFDANQSDYVATRTDWTAACPLVQ